MCGIVGMLDFDGAPIDAAELGAMNDAMAHRGPDDAGLWVGDGVGLAMRRLAIIDLDSGHQPIANEDGSVRVVLNGEIYNYRELRRELVSRGHVFTTASDTEVIVHLYEEEGADCLARLRGMFGLAIWDARRRRLLLARDRLGIKPLYYGRFGSTFLFASELKALLRARAVPRRLDWRSVEHLFSFLTTPADASIVAGVAKLEPGHLLVASADHGTTAVRRWWRIAFEPDHQRSETEWIEALRGALDEAVRLHMVSDVPVGAFLSGGVDSSAVVATMSSVHPEPVRTFSIGFEEAAFDELPAARLVAAACGSRHREEVLDPDVVAALDDIAWHLDEPFGDSSAIPTYMVSRLAARDVTVVLSGDGGDELFAGYDRYLVERREQRLARFLPAPLRRLVGAVGAALPEGATGRELLRHFALAGGERYLDAATLFKRDQRERLFRPEVRELMSGPAPREAIVAALDDAGCHWLSALQRLDLESYLPLDILTKVDRTSMAHSLEARVPLLDHPLVELAARIPPALQIRRGHGKHLFKRALADRLPEAILARPKRGFAVPLGHWFRGRLGGFVRELLVAGPRRDRGIFRTAYVEELIRRHERCRALDLHLWTLLSFELWCRAFLDRDDAGRRPTGLPAAAQGRLAAARRAPASGSAASAPWNPPSTRRQAR